MKRANPFHQEQHQQIRWLISRIASSLWLVYDFLHIQLDDVYVSMNHETEYWFREPEHSDNICNGNQFVKKFCSANNDRPRFANGSLNQMQMHGLIWEGQSFSLGFEYLRFNSREIEVVNGWKQHPNCNKWKIFS